MQQTDPQPGGSPQPEGSPLPGRRRVGLLFGVAVAVFAADLISKVIVVATLTPDRPVWLISGFLDLNLTRNSGAAFSFGTGMTILFTAIAIGVIIFILRTSRRLQSLAWAVTLGRRRGGKPDRPAAALTRSVPWRGGGLDPAAALAGVQRGRLVHRVWRDPRCRAGRPGDPPGRHQRSQGQK